MAQHESRPRHDLNPEGGAGARYAERGMPTGVAHVGEASWSVRFDADTDDWLVLPDGCVDLVLVEGEEPLVVGPATGPTTLSYRRDARALGLRLLPGAAAAVVGLHARELVDQVVPLEDLEHGPWVGDVRRAHEHLLRGELEQGNDALIAAVAARARDERPDPVSRRAAEMLRHDPNLPIATIAALVAMSERQLRRRFTDQVGYAPKRFARVMRLQYLMRLQQRQPDAHLAWLAAQAGYADQAHLVRDAHSLAGRVPSALIKQRSSVVTQQRAA